MIERPKRVTANIDQGTSDLHFKNKVVTEYMMKGGICWPTVVDIDGKKDIFGFALMAGFDIKTGKIIVFEQSSFVVLAPIINPDKSVEYPGMVSFFNTCWSKYYAQDFYFHQDFELSKKYRLEVIRSALIEPKPNFIEVPWSNEDEVKHLIWHWVKLGRLRFDKGCDVHVQLEKTQKGDKQTWPAVWALMCCLAGMDRYPYRGIA